MIYILSLRSQRLCVGYIILHSISLSGKFPEKLNELHHLFPEDDEEYDCRNHEQNAQTDGQDSQAPGDGFCLRPFQGNDTQDNREDCLFKSEEAQVCDNAERQG